jgi:hypothetical protein
MTFTVNADCTALSKDLTTSVQLLANQTKDTSEFYTPSLLPLATNGRTIIKNGKEVVEYTSSITLDINKLNINEESLNSFAKETEESKADKSKQPK